MDPNELVDGLVREGILATDADGEELVLSEAFQSRVEERRSRGDAINATERYLEPIRSNPDLLAVYSTIRERVPELGPSDLTRATLVFDQLRRGYPRVEGVPDGFAPVHGDRLRTYGALHRKAVVYIWSDDCEPCNLMREDLSTLAGEMNDDTALLTVFAPKHARFLYEEYGVKGAPTMLFLLDGDVDVRLFGAQPLSEVRKQLSKLDELLSSR